MRVPSIGLTLEERVITREGYRFAERLLRGYQDPAPGVFEMIGKGVTSGVHAIVDRCRSLVGH
jgi:hypothetical protein